MACKKAKLKKKDAEAGIKSARSRHKRHAKKQNRRKRDAGVGIKPARLGTNGMLKSKIEEKGCRDRDKASKI